MVWCRAGCDIWVALWLFRGLSGVVWPEFAGAPIYRRFELRPTAWDVDRTSDIGQLQKILAAMSSQEVGR